MTGAMYAAISGMKSHMSKLNVIGNNIANVNTYGFKAGRTTFDSSLYTMMRGGSNGTSSTGGRNPAQVGYGVSIGTIDLDMSTGNYAPTGYGTDCMIDGDGFFLVGTKDININADDPQSLKSLTLSRVGDFGFSADNYLVDGNGNVVYGFLTTDIIDQATGHHQVCDQLVPIHLPRMLAEDDGTNPAGTPLYPQMGGTPGGVSGVLMDDVGPTPTNPNPYLTLDSISIDEKTGKISGISKETNEIVVIGYIAIGNVANPNGVTQQSGTYYKAGDGSGALTVSMLGGVGQDLGIEYINESVTGSSTNPAGMKIASAGVTQLITGGLEMSKTDLATEIAEMITTQRGYQANTRIITVTDSMLEELVNIKR